MGDLGVRPGQWLHATESRAPGPGGPDWRVDDGRHTPAGARQDVPWPRHVRLAGGGAFLLYRSHIDEAEIPDGVSILGTDDATPDAGTMLYFDVRSVSREYRWTVSGNVCTWSRDAPGFSQRMVLTIAEDGATIEARGEMSRDGQPWEPDLQLTYRRVS